MEAGLAAIGGCFAGIALCVAKKAIKCKHNVSIDIEEGRTNIVIVNREIEKNALREENRSLREEIRDLQRKTCHGYSKIIPLESNIRQIELEQIEEDKLRHQIALTLRQMNLQ